MTNGTNAVTDKTNFTIKMDRSTRDAFGVLCEDIGISMSAAVNALIKQAVRQQGMSFSVLDENGFSPAEAAELKRRAEEVRAGRAKKHALVEV